MTLTLTLVACAAPEAPIVAEADTTAEDHAEEVHWGYEGEGAPENWGHLSPDYELCKSGTMQSPIDLTDAVLVEDGLLERRLGEQVLERAQVARVMDLVDNGHTIQVTTDVPVSLDLDEERFEMTQFHFHAPSEHTIDGEHSPLEVHFVHKSEAGKLAVLGVMVEPGDHAQIVEAIVAALPNEENAPRHLESVSVDMAALRPIPQRYYRYIGSLTTPPCSEGVEWIVLADPFNFSAEQIEAFVSRLHDNNRPVQPLGERELSLVSR